MLRNPKQAKATVVSKELPNIDDEGYWAGFFRHEVRRVLNASRHRREIDDERFTMMCDRLSVLERMVNADDNAG